MGEVYEKCAVIGVFDPQAAELAALALRVLDHRGPEGYGVGGMDQAGQIDMLRGPGRAKHSLTDEDVKRLGEWGAVAAVAQARYPTSGGTDPALSQPFNVNGLLFGENGNVSNIRRLEQDLAERHIDTTGKNDSWMKAAAIDHRVNTMGASIVEAIADTDPLMVGGHSCVMVGKSLDDEPTLYAWRGHFGIRPLVWGHTPNGGVMFASETVGLDAAGATYAGEVTPGTLMTANSAGVQHYELAPADPHFDIVELIYFANKNSMFRGRRIGDIREAWGRRLAAEHGLGENSELVSVVGIPNSAKTFAQGFADASELAFDPKILSKHKDDRTFLGTTPQQRAALRNVIYDLNEDAVRGRGVPAIDDSLFRNNTAPSITRMLKEAGARWVDMLIGSPPIRYPNFYGINTPNQHDLVASRQSIAEIRDDIGCRRLGYLSLEAMMEVLYEMTGVPADHFDLSAFTGEYCADIGNRDIRVPVHTGNAA